ncbi:PDZ domain-containing protein [Corynebacterium poyangense]|uniref:Zinc metalloprotease Rip1 n=1 Tax=Corynebacterium poyangense TaxID=2684405 RepID=A0A7H0SPH8_9CORY|nr:site-2 protease family protein [Corynebacterium poyangense]QNQ90453.1 PDZ domain-containing protein [Corynebacterium poyangense]
MAAYLLGVFLFAVGIAVTIALHEWGHMTAARIFGMRVRRYFIGFGPRVFSFRRGHTEYGLKAIPLGGFCDIAGMTAQEQLTPEEVPHAMFNKPWWQRIIVLLGGVIMNILVGMIILYGVAVSSGIPNPYADPSPVVGELSCVSNQRDAQHLEACSGTGPAEKAGLRPGDRIKSIDGNVVQSFSQVRDWVLERPGQEIRLGIERDGHPQEITITVASVNRLDHDGHSFRAGAIGVNAGAPPDAVRRFGPIEAIPATAQLSAQTFSASFQGLMSLPAKIPSVAMSITGKERDKESPMSVVGASRVGGELVEHNYWNVFFLLLANLNFFLALFNLIPLPPLDGGHIAVVLWEKIRDGVRRLRGLPAAGPADYSKLMPLTMTIAAILVAFGALVLVADVVNPIRLYQ